MTPWVWNRWGVEEAEYSATQILRRVWVMQWMLSSV